MPKVRPVLVHYFIKYMSANYYDIAAQIECDSCERFFSKDDIASLMNGSARGAIISDIKYPVGYMMWHPDRERRIISVINLVIRKDYRNKGLGSELLNHLTGRMRKSDYRKGTFRSVLCPIRERNKVARGFLTKFGFNCSGLLRNHYNEYGESEDAFNFYLTAYMSKTRKDNHVEENLSSGDQSSVSKCCSIRR